MAPEPVFQTRCDVSVVAVRVRAKLPVVVSLVAAFAAVSITSSFAAPSRTALKATVANSVLGKQLYRELCAQCHVFAQSGLGNYADSGEFRGPSFNNLKVSYDLTVVSLTEGYAPVGHQLAVRRMTWADLNDIAAWLAAATKNNPDVAAGTSSIAARALRFRSPTTVTLASAQTGAPVSCRNSVETTMGRVPAPGQPTHGWAANLGGYAPGLWLTRRFDGSLIVVCD